MFSRRIITILLYITILMLLFIFKPSMMFDINGNIKHFDYDTESEISKTPPSLLSIEIVLPIIALLCYFIVIILELIFL